MPDELTIELPATWRTAPFRPGFIRVLAEVKLPRGRRALGVMAMLKDGTNVLALTWDKGTRLARVCPDTGWALEERFTGRPPGPGEGALIELWRLGVQAMVQAGKDATAEMAAPGWKPSPEEWVVSDEDAMDRAYEVYCERGEGPPLSREDFEVAMEAYASNAIEKQHRGRRRRS